MGKVDHESAPPTGRKPSHARERFERIYNVLHERICLLDYPPGTRLSEDELATEFQLSRTPLRRVLGRLEAEGLIEAKHGVGNIVTNVHIEDLIQIFQLRMELAVLMGRLSPIPRSAEDLVRVRELVAQCDELILAPDIRAFAELNMAFFFELSAMTGNAPLREISERLYFQTTRCWVLMVPSLNIHDEITIFRREVADSLAALEIGDLEAVGHIRRSHISMSFRRMMQYAQQAFT